MSTIQSQNIEIKPIDLGDFKREISKIEDPKTVEKETQEYNAKLKIIEDQAENFGVYFHYADTSRFQNSFHLKQYKSYYDYVIKSLDEFIKVFNKDMIKKYNFTEHNYLNVSRIFFDIDFKDDDSIEELSNLFHIITQISDELQATKMYGLIEVIDEEIYEEIPSIFLDSKGILTTINPNLKQSHKKLSSHIFLNVYSYKHDIEIYMKNYVPFVYNPPKDIYDTSVYSSSKTNLRCSISPKVNDKEKKVREAHPDTIKILLDNPEINYNLRMAPTKEDIPIDLKPFINKVLNNPNIKLSKKQLILQGQIQDTDNPSIFQYIKMFHEFDNIENKLNNIDNWDLSKELNYYRHSVLSLDEFIENVRLIQVPQEHQTHNYGKWIETVITKIKCNYSRDRDITNIIPLYTLLGNIKDYRDNLKKLNEGTKILSEEVKAELSLLKKISNKISYYIEKYQKQSFIASEKYDIFTSEKYDTNKEYKIINNVFKTVDTLEYHYPFLNLTFKNITQFRTYFKLNSKVSNKISDKLVSFLNYKEYKKLYLEHEYEKLSIDKKDTLKCLLNKFLKWIEKSFIYEEDYKYFLGWWSEKLNILKSNEKYKTINKGLINQGTETEGGKDSLKTYFNDLLEDYVRFKSADVVNVNKGLNGSYFAFDVLVIEELPKTLKDVDNLINIIKMYSSKLNLTIEEKGEKPRNIYNSNDIIINTNHTVKSMFKNKNDCEALLKRFRILTRKSLNMKDKDLNNTLDQIKQQREMFSYILYNYLVNYDSTFFKENRNELNKIMTTYENASFPDNETEKIKTDSDFETFKTRFKYYFVDSNNRIKIRTLKTYFTKNNILLKSNSSTLKQNLIILLGDTITVSRDKNKDIKINKDEEDKAYDLIYKQYYIVEEKDPEDNNNDNNNNDDNEIVPDNTIIKDKVKKNTIDDIII